MENGYWIISVCFNELASELDIEQVLSIIKDYGFSSIHPQLFSINSNQNSLVRIFRLIESIKNSKLTSVIYSLHVFETNSLNDMKPLLISKECHLQIVKP